MANKAISYHCSECGAAAIVSDNLDEPAYCPKHPTAVIDGIVTESEARHDQSTNEQR
jgi:hypothetical protein